MPILALIATILGIATHVTTLKDRAERKKQERENRELVALQREALRRQLRTASTEGLEYDDIV